MPAAVMTSPKCFNMLYVCSDWPLVFERTLRINYLHVHCVVLEAHSVLLLMMVVIGS